jgi:hypothetical protein
MKIYLFCFSMFLALSAVKVFADATNDLEWGAMTNNVQMSIGTINGTATIKTNQPFSLIVRMKNVSTNQITFGYRYPLETTENLSWLVVSPSGKDVSPVRQPALRGSSVSRQIDPNEIFQFEYSLSSICSFHEIGTYKIVAIIDVGTKPHEPRRVDSNPLYLAVMPGEWVSETTNAPPAGF